MENRNSLTVHKESREGLSKNPRYMSFDYIKNDEGGSNLKVLALKINYSASISEIKVE